MKPAVRGTIICIEGPSAVGKTTLATSLAREVDAGIVAEPQAVDATPGLDSAAWFVDQEVARWRTAAALARERQTVVLDGDPLKGLWYNWIFAAEGWPDVNVIEPLYEARLTRNTIAFPDLYVLLQAPVDQLRERRRNDMTRARRRFELHLRLVAPQRRYFTRLQAVAPARVVLLDTTHREPSSDAVLAAVASLPAAEPDSLFLLRTMADWIRRSVAEGDGAGSPG